MKRLLRRYLLAVTLRLVIAKAVKQSANYEKTTRRLVLSYSQKTRSDVPISRTESVEVRHCESSEAICK